MAEVDGATLVARSLKQHGVQYMFGIVGVPVVPIAFAAQREGITYIGMRHEQSASYAAQAVGYLTGRPGACLVVSGPGMTNAISGLANAWSNRWPMILLGGASDMSQHGMGAFQEAPQVEAARIWCKYAAAVDRVDKIPYFVEQAVRTLELSVLAKYAFGLAQAFNAFYHRYSIINEERADTRIWRAAAVSYYRNQLTLALELMGCTVPTRM